MVESAKPAIENKDPGPVGETAGWDKLLFTPERIEKWLRGEITLQQLNGIAGTEMLEMAVIGFSLYEQGRYADAEIVFRGLCSLDPEEGYYETMLGAVFLARGDLDSAEACFDRAIQLDGEDIAPYVNRGEVYLRKGKVIEAAHDLKKAVDLDPESKNPMSQRARLLSAAALETIARAKRLAAAGSTAAGMSCSALN